MTFESHSPPETRHIRCKPKHTALKSSAPGSLRARVDVRSRCPGWVTGALQARLLEEALVDPSAGTDAYGRPRKVWNAVADWVFIGVSSNEPVPAYNCYPEVPLTELAETLQQRAARSVEDVLTDEDIE